jgi:dimethylargininase
MGMIRGMVEDRLFAALVRRPSSRLADGIVTHVERRPVDVALAQAQWEGYVRALAAAGWDPLEVDPADDCPDGVFVEDTMVVYADVAVIARPGADRRRAEVPAAERAAAGLGLRLESISAPGTLDGGDVLQAGTAVYVGTGRRTNSEGARQLSGILEPLGATVVAVPVTRFLHLKTAVTALADGTVVGCPPLVPDLAFFPRFLAVPEASGAQVALLGDQTLLLAADCPRSAELYAGLGYKPVTVEISEFQKLEGCVTCLSVLIAT